MRAAFVGLAGAIALGCVTASSSPRRQGELRDVVQTEDGMILRTTPDYAIKGSLARPVDEAFAAMLVAYEKLGIEAKTNDPNGHNLGNTAVTAFHRFNGEDLSRYFECGRDAFGGPHADHYRITFSVVTSLQDNGAGATKIETLVTARGSDPAGDGADVYCSTTGHLEAELIKLATAT